MSESEPATHTIGVVAIRGASASASPGVPATSTRPADAGTSARSASTAAARGLDDATRTRSEERRVGKECTVLCRWRGSAGHEKKKRGDGRGGGCGWYGERMVRCREGG